MPTRVQTPVARRVAFVLGAIVIALLVAACGQASHPTQANPDGTAASGFYVDAGPITYQVQLSRELNQYATEDKAYLTGVNQTAPAPDQEWFGVFIWAKNQTKRTATTSDLFTITDTQGNIYYPVVINPQLNPLAWTSQTLKPGATEPAPDTPASYDLTQGGELLFKLNDSAYSNRPLTLNIYASGQKQPSEVPLDL